MVFTRKHGDFHGRTVSFREGRSWLQDFLNVAFWSAYRATDPPLEYFFKAAYSAIGNKIATFKKNIMPRENQWLEDVFPIEMVPFLGTS